MDSDDGHAFVKHLAHFVRSHEKALANALQFRRQPSTDASSSGHAGDPSKPSAYHSSIPASSTSSALAAAFSLGPLNFSSHNLKPAKLALTPHHLYYLLDHFEELGIPIGPMKVRLENIHTEASPANYVSFLGESQRSRGRSDRDSIHSVSSVRSVMSGMSSIWSSFGIGSSASLAKTERAQAQLVADLKYLYSAFTKIPCLRLSPDHKARLLGGYEEFPFDTAVPLIAFKNLSALEICDVDFRQFYGWDRLADQLRSLTVRRSNLDDPTDLLVNIVLDDMDKRRRRSSKAQGSPVLPWPSSPSLRFSEAGRKSSAPSSPMAEDRLGQSTSPKQLASFQTGSDTTVAPHRPRTESVSPSRPCSSRQDYSYRHVRASPAKMKRSASGSSNSSTHSSGHLRSRSSSNLLTMGFLPASKWRFLRHLSLADNSLTSIAPSGLGPLSNTLHSLDLSTNLFTDVPDCIATLTALRALNLSNCMVESLHSLAKNPVLAITVLNLRANRLASIAGIERLLSLERLDLRDNRLQDPMELARLTGIRGIHEIWVLRNPFVKTHGHYRVTIFNLFRSTPGYSKDVVIDSSAPGYNERRQLRERAVEPEGVPIVNDLPPGPIPTHQPMKSGTSHARDDNLTRTLPRPSPPQMAQSEIVVGSSQRRKGPRRRIVDLALDQTPSSADQHRDPVEIPREKSRSLFRSATADDVCPSTESGLQPPVSLAGSPTTSKLWKNSTTEVSDKGRSLATEIQNLGLDGEAYRQKLEALKSEVGSNWLSVLGEERYQLDQKVPTANTQYTRVEMMRSEPSAFRTASHSIVSSTRTLG